MSNAVSIVDNNDVRPQWREAVGVAALFIIMGAYAFIGVAATLFYPFVFFVFFAPLALIGFITLPRGKAAPKSIIVIALPIAIALMPLWPTYLHLKFGPLPIITPSRLILYALSLVWLYDMTASPLRRGQFFAAIKRTHILSACVFGLFALSALSVPLAEGKIVAGQEFIRHAVIWLLPFCAFATYVRSFQDLKRVLAALVLAAALSSGVAIVEVLTQTLMAAKLSPFISDDAVWLQIAQDQKIRDGVFRAQASHTHPLSLGEFLTFCGPLALGLCACSRGRVRIFWIGAAGVIFLGVLATSSRAAMLASIIGSGSFLVLLVLRFLSKPRHFRFRPLAGFAMFCFIAVSPVVLYGAHKIIVGDESISAANSTQSRLDQIEQAWPKIAKRPLNGYGTGRAARIIGYWGLTLTLDNYYLSLAVDNGLGAPILFAATIMVAGLTFRRRIIGRAPPGFGAILLGLACSFAAFFLTRSIISQTGNLNFMFPLLGAIVGAGVRFRRPTRPWPLKRPAEA